MAAQPPRQQVAAVAAQPPRQQVAAVAAQPPRQQVATVAAQPPRQQVAAVAVHPPRQKPEAPPTENNVSPQQPAAAAAELRQQQAAMIRQQKAAELRQAQTERQAAEIRQQQEAEYRRQEAVERRRQQDIADAKLRQQMAATAAESRLQRAAAEAHQQQAPTTIESRQKPVAIGQPAPNKKEKGQDQPPKKQVTFAQNTVLAAHNGRSADRPQIDEQPRDPIRPQNAMLTDEAPEAETCFDLSTIQDRVYGAILGQALGDAFGLQVEGNDSFTIADRYPDGLQYPYKGSYKGYAPNDWTDATDCTVLIMRSLAAYFTGATDKPAHQFAHLAASWFKQGFPELGDVAGLTPEAVVLRAINQGSAFLNDPIGTATALKGPKADNGALIRAIPCVFTIVPEDWARLFCDATHSDDRCAAANLMFVKLAHQLVLHPGGPIDPRLAVDPIRLGGELIADPARKADYLHRLTNTKRIADLDLGGRDNRSYVFKTLCCAMWAFRQLVVTPPSRRDAKFFREAITTVAMQGGDASANCAVVGAILGSAIGRQNLPDDWIRGLPYGAWLEIEISKFVQAAGPTWRL